MRMCDHVLVITASLLMLTAISLIFLWAPQAQFAAGGLAMKIMYIHVPSAWTAMHSFLLSAIAAGCYLRGRDAGWDRFSASAVEVGMVFATCVLVTGPVWAKPVWGVYWPMEPRLMTFALMWFTYAGYLLLRAGLSGQPRQAPVCAVFALIASVTTPLVYYSVKLIDANKQSHPVKVELTGEMRIALYGTLLAVTLLWLALLMIRKRIADGEAALEARTLEGA